MNGTAIGCASWLIVGTFIASLFRFGGDATSSLGVWIFLGGLVLFLILYSFVSQRSTGMTRITAPPSFKYMDSQANFTSNRVSHKSASDQHISNRDTSSQAIFAATPTGCVYLLKAGPFYKLGKAQNFEQRLRQTRQQLPYPVEVVYVFETGSMLELEVYWRGRFQERRTHSDWFLLTDEDVYEFTQQV